MNVPRSQSEIPRNADVAAQHAGQSGWKRAYRRFIVHRIAASTRKKFDVRMRGLSKPDTGSIPIIAINHKNDDDPVVMVAGLLANPAMVPLFRCSVFALGEHVFQPGFLGAYVVKEPRWLSYLLFQLNIGRFMRAMGAYPVMHARSRYLLSHFNDVIALRGNVLLEEVLAGDIEQFLPGASPQSTIQSVMTFRYRDELYTTYDFPVFRPPLDRMLWERQQERIRAFVSTLAALADRGRVIVNAPEGMFTRDGKPERVRSGLFQIVNAMTKDTAMLPLNITYDHMGSGRAIAYVTFGKSLPLHRGIPKHEFNARVADALYRDAPIPFCQLAAEAMRDIALGGSSSIGLDTLRDRMRERGREFAAAGYAVLPDPDCNAEFDSGMTRFVGYIRESGFAVAGGVISFDPAVVLDERIQPNGFARQWWYCYNELQSRLAQRHGDFG